MTKREVGEATARVFEYVSNRARIKGDADSAQDYEEIAREIRGWVSEDPQSSMYDACCPICQEMACDPGCPLFSCRTHKQTKCLDCGWVLPVPVPDHAPDVISCDCGLRYSKKLLQEADPALWEQIREQRLFKRTGNTLIVYSPPEAILNEEARVTE